jgi:Fe-S-cluster containining protein
MASACDSCPVPGHCCRQVMLGGGSFARSAKTIEEAERYIRTAHPWDEGGSNPETQVVGPPLPFHPLMRRQDGAWIWWCPNLDQRSGRCLDYENRPLCCSDYEPGTDRLCVLHEPEPIAEPGSPEAQLEFLADFFG